LFCQGPAGHAHHDGKFKGGGTSIKCSDYHTVPLCPKHHAEYHQRGQIGFWNPETTKRKFSRAIELLQKQYQLQTTGQ
jgi:hypothetical protein